MNMFENEPWSLRPIRVTALGYYCYFEWFGGQRSVRFISIADGSLGIRHFVTYAFLLMTKAAGPDEDLAERLARKAIDC